MVTGHDLRWFNISLTIVLVVFYVLFIGAGLPLERDLTDALAVPTAAATD